MLPRSILTSTLLLLSIQSATPAVETSDGAKSPLLYTVAKVYEPLAWLHGGERFPSGAAIFISSEDGRRPLVPNFAASADPSVSFDGQKVLFTGKMRAGDPWQIWELDISSGTPRQITSFHEDCIRPLYLPDDSIVYARKLGGRFVIESRELGSGKTLDLAYLPSDALPTDILRDGRILFESAFPLGSQEKPEIYTVYSDGSGVESYRCDHATGRHSARQQASGDTVFATTRGLARFTSARAQEIRIPVPSGEYAGDVVETSAEEWLLAWRPDSKASYRLMRWIPGGTDLRPVLSEPGANVIQPVPLAPRTVPNRHPSGLHDWDNANLLCLSAYTSRHLMGPGSVHGVRLYTRDDSGQPKLLGTAPVESDGSFFVHVPSEQPLQLELLDASGRTLQRETGYFWMRRGEQRVCTGCHSGPETAPENAVPQTLLKSTTPADLTAQSAPSAGGH